MEIVIFRKLSETRVITTRKVKRVRKKKKTHKNQTGVVKKTKMRYKEQMVILKQEHQKGKREE